MIAAIIMIIIYVCMCLWGMHKITYVNLLGLVLLEVAISFIIYKIHIKKKPERKENLTRYYLRALLVFYIFFLFSLTFNINRSTIGLTFDRLRLLARFYWQANIVPFRTIRDMLHSDYPVSFVVTNIGGNILALMPLGVLLPLVFPKTRMLPTYTLIVTLLILFIELVQFFFGVGKMDIDDFILNIFGALIAFGLFKLVLKYKENRQLASEEH